MFWNTLKESVLAKVDEKYTQVFWDFNFRKINTVVKRMSGCVYYLEIIMKEHITENKLFFWDKHTIAEKIAQTMDDSKISS